ncbi:ABC transporter substrate-binding protein [Clostridium oceanicum]|uniref:ABC transporter substrate-binding protein n=1 Tax=Clostridium oceanicum TaxID=1543 RepID=A0ABP3V151_9CLOT
MKLKNKLLSIVFMIFIVIGALTGCSQKTQVMKDREGNEFKLPKKVDTIISTAPSNTEVLVELGLGDKLVAIDKYSKDVKGVNKEAKKIDFRTPDVETIVSLKPDIVIASGHNRDGNEDPFSEVKEAGIEVVYIPSSSSIEGIYDDIKFISKVTDTEKKGNEIVSDMKKEIKSMKEIGDKIKGKKSVYFEIGSTPSLFTFGKDTFLNEMIEVIGGENIFKNQKSWLTVNSESVIKANPDVIFTSEPKKDALKSIKTRTGWQNIKAVKNNNVYYIDKNYSSRPSNNIIKALKEMSKDIYKDKHE